MATSQVYNPYDRFDAPKSNPYDRFDAPAKPATPVKAESPSFLHELGHAAGVDTRAAIEGALALPEMIADPIDRLVGLPSSSEEWDKAMTRAGLPQPKGGTEHLASALTRAITGAASFAGGGQVLADLADEGSILKAAALDLAGRPGTQAAAAVSGTLGQQAAKKAGLGAGWQTAAGLVGSFLPVGVSAIPRGVYKASYLEGTEPALRRARFARLNMRGTPSQISRSTPLTTIEGWLTKAPGAHQAMRNFGIRQGEAMGTAVRKLADRLSLETTPTSAGEAVIDGLTNPDTGFLAKFRNVSSTLYASLDHFIKPGDPVNISNTEHAFYLVTRPIMGAKNISGQLRNPALASLRDAFKADARSGVLPWDAVKALRSRIGSMMTDDSMALGIPHSDLKTLYGALSRDMEVAVENTHNPLAIKLFRRANAYSRAGHQRIEQILSPLLRRNIPEKIYHSAMEGTHLGATKIRTIMMSLPRVSQRVVASSVLRRLGEARPGVQTEEQTFSPQTFLMNWNKLDPAARRILFDRFGPKYVKGLNDLSSAASDIAESNRNFTNPSGTAAGYFVEAFGMGMATAALHGDLPLLATTLGGMYMIPKYGAKLLLNPHFGAWLARYGKEKLPLSAVATRALMDAVSHPNTHRPSRGQ